MPYVTFRPCVLCGPVLQQTLFYYSCISSAASQYGQRSPTLPCSGTYSSLRVMHLVVGAADAGICTDFMMTGTLERQLGQRQQQCHTAEHANRA